jgi:hypothetical protein
MPKTPEGKVKDDLKRLLESYGIFPASKAGNFQEPLCFGWYYMPVGSNFTPVKGIPDFIGNYKGMFWAVETKAPGKKPTGFQKLQIEAINMSGSPCFVIDGDFTEFEAWLERIRVWETIPEM